MLDRTVIGTIGLSRDQMGQNTVDADMSVRSLGCTEAEVRQLSICIIGVQTSSYFTPL